GRRSGWRLRGNYRQEQVFRGETTPADFDDLLEDDVQTGTGRTFQRRQRDLWRIQPEFRMSFTELTALALELRYQDVSYDEEEPGTAVDYRNMYVDAAIQRELSPYNRLEFAVFGSRYDPSIDGRETDAVGARIGYQQSTSDISTWFVEVGAQETRRDSLSEPGVELSDTSFLWNIGYRRALQVTTWRLDLGQQVTPSGSGNLVERDLYRVSMEHQLDPRWRLHLSAVYLRSDAVATESGVTSSDRDYAQGRVALGFRLTPAWTVQGLYALTYQDFANIPGDAQEHEVRLSFIYRPPLPTQGRQGGTGTRHGDHDRVLDEGLPERAAAALGAVPRCAVAAVRHCRGAGRAPARHLSRQRGNAHRPAGPERRAFGADRADELRGPVHQVAAAEGHDQRQPAEVAGRMKRVLVRRGRDPVRADRPPARGHKGPDGVHVGDRGRDRGGVRPHHRLHDIVHRPRSQVRRDHREPCRGGLSRRGPANPRRQGQRHLQLPARADRGEARGDRRDRGADRRVQGGARGQHAGPARPEHDRAGPRDAGARAGGARDPHARAGPLLPRGAVAGDPADGRLERAARAARAGVHAHRRPLRSGAPGRDPHEAADRGHDGRSCRRRGGARAAPGGARGRPGTVLRRASRRRQPEAPDRRAGGRRRERRAHGSRLPAAAGADQRDQLERRGAAETRERAACTAGGAAGPHCAHAAGRAPVPGTAARAADRDARLRQPETAAGAGAADRILRVGRAWRTPGADQGSARTRRADGTAAHRAGGAGAVPGDDLRRGRDPAGRDVGRHDTGEQGHPDGDAHARHRRHSGRSELRLSCRAAAPPG